MTPTIRPETALLRTDPDGTIRVGGTRLIVDLVLRAYRRGESAEAIAEGFPPITVAEVESVLGYYHAHKEELDAYLAERQRQADTLRREIEDRHGTGPGYRDRLLHRLRERSGG